MKVESTTLSSGPAGRAPAAARPVPRPTFPERVRPAPARPFLGQLSVSPNAGPTAGRAVSLRAGVHRTASESASSAGHEVQVHGVAHRQVAGPVGVELVPGTAGRGVGL